MAIQLRASSSSATRKWTHDVFLSFRGEDARHNFTGHLYNNLVQKGINTFIDDELARGEEISQALLQAIEGSKCSLIVFSENYASSKWCLDELVHILKCRRSKQQKVWPIFYKVDPADVRHQRGSFGDALAKHESNFKGNNRNMKKVLSRRTALTEAANLAGWHFSNGYEYKLLNEIVEEISAQVKEPISLDVAKCPVGLDSRVQHVLEHLDVGGSDVRMVGIWGTGGIGKTTIAKVVYNSIAQKFDRSCFLANVREESEVHGRLLNLQKILLSEFVGGNKLKVNNVDEGITLLREKLRHKRILLVLDDVNKQNQLNKLAGAADWFGPGSRIIITTRDKHLSFANQVIPMYKACELDHDEACKLFSSFAFKNNENLGDNEKLSVSTVVRYAQGLPLALEVLGSHLCRLRPIDRWQAELDGYKIDPNEDIQKILKISYDELDQKVKEVFLDIACFFKGQKKDDVIQILKSCDRINPRTGIEVLEEKALIHVECGDISIHDLLEDMGKKIVRDEELPKEPGERKRLWYYKDVLQVLTKNTGTKKIEGIIVKMPTSDEMPTTVEICMNPKCFKRMENLKIFRIVNARFYGKIDYYPEQLRILEWHEFPLQSWPSNFNMKELIQLSMPCSSFLSLGKGFKPSQNLKSINFRECKFLTEIPDLSGCPNLERMDLYGCTSLVEVHSSVGFLEKLVHLDLYGCSNLVKLPREVNWRSLRHLNLIFCERLESFPEIGGEMKCLTRLSLIYCSAIKELPSSIRHLTNLRRLSIWHCNNLANLPFSIYQLQTLREVELNECPKLKTIPNKGNSAALMPTGSKEDRIFHKWLNQLMVSGCNSLSDSDLTDFLDSLDCAFTLGRIDLSRSNIVSLPEWLCKFIWLEELRLSGCRNLVEIPQFIWVKYLDVSDCVSLERISRLSKILEGKESQMIKHMDLSNCCRLIENLVKEANEDCEAVEALSPFFLSCQKSKFTIKFPGSEIPECFSCQMDFQGLRRFEFFIEMLPNFKWENTGLALCILKGQSDDYMWCHFEVFIYINDVKVLHLPSYGGNGVYSRLDHVCLHYVPFLEMRRLHYEPPFMCRVIIFNHFMEKSNYVFLKSCGIHLVMPPNEDVCMKLSRSENITSDLPNDILKDDNDDDDDDDGDAEDDDGDGDGAEDDYGDDDDGHGWWWWVVVVVMMMMMMMMIMDGGIEV